MLTVSSADCLADLAILLRSFPVILASFIYHSHREAKYYCAAGPLLYSSSVGVMQEAHMTLFQFALQRPVGFVLPAYITSSAAPLLHCCTVTVQEAPA